MKYELIDSLSGRTLVRGANPREALANAARYILDMSVSYSDVSYVVIRNGRTATVLFQATGSDLRELLEDELDEDAWGASDPDELEDAEW